MYERVIDMEPAAPPPPRPRVTTALAALGLACLLSAGIAWTWYRAARLPSLPAPEDPDAVAQGGAKVRQLVLPPPGRLLADWSPEDGGLTHQLRVAFVRFDLGSPTPRLVSELVQPIAAPHPAQFEGAVDSAFAVPPVEPLPVIHRYHLPGPLHRWHDWRKREPIDFTRFQHEHVGFRLVPYVHDGQHFVRHLEGVRRSGGLRRPDEEIEASALDTPEGFVLLVDSTYEHAPRPFDLMTLAVLEPLETTPRAWSADAWSDALDRTAREIVRRRADLRAAEQRDEAPKDLAWRRMRLDHRTRALLRIGQVWPIRSLRTFGAADRPAARSFDSGILMRARLLAGDATALDDEALRWQLESTTGRMRADGVFEHGVSAAAAELSFWSRVRIAVDEPRIAGLAAELVDRGIAHDDRLRTLEGELDPELKPAGLFERRDLKQWDWFIRQSLAEAQARGAAAGLSAAAVRVTPPLDPPLLPFLLLLGALTAALAAVWPMRLAGVPLSGALSPLRPVTGLAAVLLGLALASNYLETHDGRLGLQVTGLAAAAIGTLVLSLVSRRGMGYVATAGFALAAVLGASSWVTTVQNAAYATALGVAALPLLSLALWRPGDRGPHAPQPALGYLVLALPCAVFFVLYARHLVRKIESPASRWHELEVWPLAASLGVVLGVLVFTTVLNILGEPEEEDQEQEPLLPSARAA